MVLLVTSAPGRADLYLLALDPDLPGRLASRGRATHGRPVGEPENAAVPGAAHAAVGQLPLI